MTDAIATLYDAAYDVPSPDGRVFSLGYCRRILSGVVVGLGAVAVACALATSVAVAAAWIVSAAFSTNPDTHPSAPTGPRTLVFPDYYVPHSPAKHKIAHAPALTHVAALAAAAAPAALPDTTLLLSPQPASEWANGVPLSRPDPAKHEIAASPVGQIAPQVAPATPPPASAPEKHVAPRQARSKSTSLPGPGSHTAVYDIVAHTVYLPSGEGLEAHSGLGGELDDPRYVNVKNRGPTPPNVYELVLREHLFHGVRAIRLTPVGNESMFGRDGILAHSYMLGPNGQSNGCVSFRNYPTFLRAVLKGEVDRLVVVPNLATGRSRTAMASVGSIDNATHNRQ